MTNLLKSNKIFDLKNAEFNSDEEVQNKYRAKTKNIEISVNPEFINSQEGMMGALYIWTYNIKIENKGDAKVRLINRHWKIVDEKGGIQKVDGEGVVGKQPEIEAGNSFEYDSGVHLSHPSGIMSGHYKMMDEDGKIFEVQIPSFSLDSPGSNHIVN